MLFVELMSEPLREVRWTSDGACAFCRHDFLHEPLCPMGNTAGRHCFLQRHAPAAPLHPLAQVMFEGRPWIVIECEARYNVNVGVRDFRVAGLQCRDWSDIEDRLVFKDYEYTLWTPCMTGFARAQDVEVVSNEPDIRRAAALIKGGPVDPVLHAGMYPVLDTNLDHNVHGALVHIMSPECMLQRFGEEFVAELPERWAQSDIAKIYFQEIPWEEDSSSDEIMDSDEESAGDDEAGGPS